MTVSEIELSPFRILWNRISPVAYTGGTMFVSQLLMVAVGLWTARVLGPGAKGQLAAVTTWVQILTWVGTFGINTAISVRVAETFNGDRGDPELRMALGNSLVYSVAVGTVLAVICFVVLDALLAHLGPGTTELLVLSLVALPAGILSAILLSLQLSVRRAGRMRIAQVVAPAILILLLFVTFLVHNTLRATDIAIATIGSTAGVLVLLAWGLPWRRVGFSKLSLTSDFRFGGSVAAGGILGLVNLRLDILSMSLFVSTSQIGLYAAANNMMGPILIIPLAAAAHLTPKVAERRTATNTTRLIFREAALFSGLAALIGLSVAGSAPFLVPLLLGSSYNNIVVLIWILIPGFLARSFAAVVVAGAIGQRRARVGNIGEAVAAVLTIGLLPFAIGRYGIRGAAVVSTVAYASSAVVICIVMWRTDRHHAESITQNGPGPGILKWPGSM